MTSVRTLLTVTVLAALLAACNVTVTPVGPGFDYSVNAQALASFDNVPTVRRTITLSAGEAAWLEVSFPTSPAADLMYVELDATTSTSGLELEWWNLAQSSRQLVSYSSTIFGPPSVLASSDASPSATAPAIERSSISVDTWECFGPCIARPYSSGAKAIRVFNGSGSTRTVQVYAYGLEFTDQLEPNASASAAAANPVFVSDIDDFIQGAIEFSGDDDYIRIDCPASAPLNGVVQLQFDSVFAGDLVLRTAQGDVEPGGALSPFLTCPTTVRVFAADGTAGPSLTSRYTITIK